MLVQYYATVDPGSEADNEKILWLSKENVEDRTEMAVPMTGIAAMLSSGLSVGGVITDPLAAMGQVGHLRGFCVNCRSAVRSLDLSMVRKIS